MSTKCEKYPDPLSFLVPLSLNSWIPLSPLRSSSDAFDARQLLSTIRSPDLLPMVVRFTALWGSIIATPSLLALKFSLLRNGCQLGAELSTTRAPVLASLRPSSRRDAEGSLHGRHFPPIVPVDAALLHFTDSRNSGRAASPNKSGARLHREGSQLLQLQSPLEHGEGQNEVQAPRPKLLVSPHRRQIVFKLHVVAVADEETRAIPEHHSCLHSPEKLLQLTVLHYHLRAWSFRNSCRVARPASAHPEVLCARGSGREKRRCL